MWTFANGEYSNPSYVLSKSIIFLKMSLIYQWEYYMNMCLNCSVFGILHCEKVFSSFHQFGLWPLWSTTVTETSLWVYGHQQSLLLLQGISHVAWMSKLGRLVKQIVPIQKIIAFILTFSRWEGNISFLTNWGIVIEACYLSWV